MRFIETNYINQDQKNAILRLWNKEYPDQLRFPDMIDLDIYLGNLENQSHYFAIDKNEKIIAWTFLFERENEKCFAMILDSSFQRKGLGTSLLQRLKEKETILNGWVIDHANYIRQNGEIYASPLSFYLKNDFVVCKNIRLETEKISAVKIKWQIQK